MKRYQHTVATGLKYDTNIKFMKSSNCLHCCVDPREKNSIATEIRKFKQFETV
jgi:hypothetical protein